MYRYLLPLVLAVLYGCSRADPPEHTWVDVPAGCFQMGEDRVYREEGPVHGACVEAFQMTETEITNAQFEAFIDATGYVTRAERGWSASETGGPGIDVPPGSAVFSSPSGRLSDAFIWWTLIEGANWRAPKGPGQAVEVSPDAPVVHVTLEDARAYADWAGGRLPSETEWEYAARGGLERKQYAWGDSPPSMETPEANTWQGVFPIDDTGDDGFQGAAPVASFPANGFGLYDMIGNVWELTDSPYTPSHADADRAIAGANGLDPSQPGIPVTTIRGGSFLCWASYCYRYRPAARHSQDTAFGTSHIGFRIIRDVPTLS